MSAEKKDRERREVGQRDSSASNGSWLRGMERMETGEWNEMEAGQGLREMGDDGGVEKGEGWREGDGGTQVVTSSHRSSSQGCMCMLCVCVCVCVCRFYKNRKLQIDVIIHLRNLYVNSVTF